MAIAQYSSQKKSPRQKARRFFGAPAGISPAGDKLRLPGSDQKKTPRQKAGSFFAKVRPNGVYQGKALRRLLENACPGISACEDGQYAGLYDSAKAAKLIFEGFQPCR